MATKPGRALVIMALGLSLGAGIGSWGAHAYSLTGHPNPSSHAGRQGTKSNQHNPSLDGKRNRHREKNVTNRTSSPFPKAMVAKGASVFKAQCETCHGPGGSGTLSAPRLMGPSGVVYGFRTEPRMEAFIASQMPANHPGTLTRTEVKDVSAYIWTIARAK